MLEILPKIIRYKLFYNYGFGQCLPLNVTVSLLYTCNSRCKTCNVWKKKADNFTIEEYEKTFKFLGESPYWFTLSGGEPFLRQDIVEICVLVHNICKPGIINIPTNGSLTDIIAEKLPKILDNCRDCNIVINLSLDQIGEKHNNIRGIPDNFNKSMRTLKVLKDLKKEYSNLTVGIHSVISNFNIDEIESIYEELIKLEPDSYITEIAEERVELGTIGSEITPCYAKYSHAIDFLSQKIQEQDFHGLARLTRAFRLNYYEMVKKVLKEKKQIIPCYAGVASVQISPDGEIWTCCIRAESLGNLRENDYDLKKIWFSDKAKEMRNKIKNKECYCPLANASYTNMLMHIPTLFRVGWRFLIGK